MIVLSLMIQFSRIFFNFKTCVKSVLCTVLCMIDWPALLFMKLSLLLLSCIHITRALFSVPSICFYTLCRSVSLLLASADVNAVFY